MSEILEVKLARDQLNFVPGDSIRGELVVQSLPPEMESIEIRLLWHTRGKGDMDVEVVAAQTVTKFSEGQSIPFEFQAPAYPNSFSLKLVSLVWVIEAIAFPSRTAANQEIVISPTGQVNRPKEIVS